MDVLNKEFESLFLENSEKELIISAFFKAIDP